MSPKYKHEQNVRFTALEQSSNAGVTLAYAKGGSLRDGVPIQCPCALMYARNHVPLGKLYPQFNCCQSCSAVQGNSGRTTSKVASDHVHII